MTIRITAKTDGFWRCGVAHPATPTNHKDDRFDADQLTRLKAEAELIVQVIDDPVASKDGEPSDEGDNKEGDAVAKVVKAAARGRKGDQAA